MEIRWTILPRLVMTVEGDFWFAGLLLQIGANSQRKKNPELEVFMNDSHV